MANRFTDTEKWKDPWFCGLNCKEKLFWVYLCDNCDHAGIWKVNWPLVNFYIGEFIFNKEVFNERIVFLSDECWFLKKFVLFQQKVSDVSQLNPNVKCHKSIIDILDNKGLGKGCQTLKQGLGKGVGNSKGKVIVKVKERIVKENQFDFNVIWDKYPKKLGKNAAERHFNATVKTEVDYADIQKALSNFLSSKQGTGDPKYIPHGSTWFNNWRDWVNYIEIKSEKELDDERDKKYFGFNK